MENKNNNIKEIQNDEYTLKYNKWVNEGKMCQICNKRKATINLDLKVGSHRECLCCWNS